MKRITFFIILIYLLLLQVACTTSNAGANDSFFASAETEIIAPEKLCPVGYVEWIEDKTNGIKIEKTIEGFTYSVMYKPVEYVALLDLKKASVAKQELQNKIEEYNGLQYYTFKITTPDEGELLKKKLTNTNDYYSRIQYYSFEMQKDLKLIEGTDTLDCVLFHFERTYGVSPDITFVVGFPLTENKFDKTLLYDEKIFGAGKIFLTVQSKNYKKIPLVITG
jgi:hypothetical protein